MASSIHPDYPLRKMPRRSRTMAASDPYAWERSVRKNVQLGGKYPVRISQGMSWKGHGASPGNREKKAEERAMRRQRGQALKNMKGRPNDEGLDFLRPRKKPTPRETQVDHAWLRRFDFYRKLSPEDKVKWEKLSDQEKDGHLDAIKF